MPAGEFFSMLGPSGCGKTTTLRMIAGFERPTSGRILLDGHDMALPPPHRRTVNTVFQNYALFPHLNVFDNVAFGLRRAKRSKAEIRKRVTEALELVQLTGLENRRPAQMSGGAPARPGEPRAGAHVGRAAAARRAGARARAAARGAAAGRAARRAGCEA